MTILRDFTLGNWKTVITWATNFNFRKKNLSKNSLPKGYIDPTVVYCSKFNFIAKIKLVSRSFFPIIPDLRRAPPLHVRPLHPRLRPPGVLLRQAGGDHQRGSVVLGGRGHAGGGGYDAFFRFIFLINKK